LEINIPKSPEDLLRIIVESQDQTYIDQNIMPHILSMAKNHVDAINTINTHLKDLQKDKLEVPERDHFQKQLESLQQENHDLTTGISNRNNEIMSLNTKLQSLI
jgi:hypothetical protein